MSISVTVSSLGGAKTVEVDEAADLSVALAAAGIDAQAQGLDIEVDGAPASATDPVENGSQVLATPRAPKLG